MGNIQSYQRDYIVGTNASAQVIADQLNEQAEKQRMAMAWQDIQRSLAPDYGVVRKLNKQAGVRSQKVGAMKTSKHIA